MSDTCGVCGADRGTVGIVLVLREAELCKMCLNREGIDVPVPRRIKLSRASRPKLPLKADKWEITFRTDGVEVKGDGWWLIGVQALLEPNPDMEDRGLYPVLACVYARRRKSNGGSEEI